MKNFSIKYLSITAVIIFVLSLLYFLPTFVISKEKQFCLINKHCAKIDCTIQNKKLNNKDLVEYNPMCINYECKCEWIGNLQHF